MFYILPRRPTTAHSVRRTPCAQLRWRCSSKGRARAPCQSCDGGAERRCPLQRVLCKHRHLRLGREHACCVALDDHALLQLTRGRFPTAFKPLIENLPCARPVVPDRDRLYRPESGRAVHHPPAFRKGHQDIVGELILLDYVGRMNRRCLPTTPREDIIETPMLGNDPRQLLTLVWLKVGEVSQDNGPHLFHSIALPAFQCLVHTAPSCGRVLRPSRAAAHQLQRIVRRPGTTASIPCHARSEFADQTLEPTNYRASDYATSYRIPQEVKAGS